MIQQTSEQTNVKPAEDKARRLKSKWERMVGMSHRFMKKLESLKGKQGSTVKVRTVEDVYSATQKNQPKGLIDLTEEREMKDPVVGKGSAVEKDKEPEKAPDTVTDFLKEKADVFEGKPILTTTGDSSSDDVPFVWMADNQDCVIIDKVDAGSSSLKEFKPSLKDFRLDRTTVNPAAVDRELEKSAEVARSLRTPLERSASSIRRERKELRNMLEFGVGKQAIDEGVCVTCF